MANEKKVYLKEVGEELEDHLDWGDDMSAWVRDACRLKLDLINDEDPEISDYRE